MHNDQTRLPPYFLDVAVPAPLRRTFQYLPPLDPAAALVPGCRVLVPFGRQKLIGILLGRTTRLATEKSKLRRVLDVIDAEPVITESIMKLCLWAADYYHHPIGEVMMSAIPTLLRQGKSTSAATQSLTLTAKGSSLNPDNLSRAPKQRALLKYLQQNGATTRKLLAADGFNSTHARTLAEKKLALWQVITLPAVAITQGVTTDYAGIEPNSDQRKVLAAINKPMTYLIHGITGSGKTEIYLRAIEQALKQDLQALVLIPEISLTPQTLKRFSSRFNVPIDVLHSGMTDTERLEGWRRSASGAARIILGTRSAIFTPMPKPGLIVVDEEHDGSFKQQIGFRYSARDLAVMRGQLENIPVILGSATPSLESLHNCELGKYKLLSLPERTSGANREIYRLVNLKYRELNQGFAPETLNMIRSELGTGNQVLIFINRRGFAPVLYCQDCAWIANCDRCDARLTLHMARKSLRCHHCGKQQPLLSNCARCSSDHLVPLGQGTQRIEESLTAFFPDFPVIRIDGDSTRNRDALQNAVNKVHQGEPGILVGTQLLAKGHHFPDVTLVVMLDIDAGFFSSEFRSLEKTGQLILQVGGRSGRENKQGTVMIQTQFVDQPLLLKLINNGYLEFAATVLEERRTYQMPPFSYHCIIKAESMVRRHAMDFLDQVVQKTVPGPSVEMLGPIVPTMEKREGRFRAHLLLSSLSRTALHRAIDNTIVAADNAKLSSRVRWSVNVDPSDGY